MAKKSKTGVLKRLREVKKAEKAALKREELRVRKESGGGATARVETEKTEPQVATVDDMAGYGFPVAGDEEEEGGGRRKEAEGEQERGANAETQGRLLAGQLRVALYVRVSTR